MTKPLKLPKFKTEDAERDFWAKIDLADYFESKDFQAVSFPNLKPSVKTISIRLPEALLNSLKTIANERDVPYQSFMKMIPAERIEEALRSTKD